MRKYFVQIYLNIKVVKFKLNKIYLMSYVTNLCMIIVLNKFFVVLLFIMFAFAKAKLHKVKVYIQKARVRFQN